MPRPPVETPPGGTPRAVLELIIADRRGPSFSLPSDRATTLGRSADADIPVADRLVSRLHASIRLEAAGWTLRDLGSRNGTRLDGVAVGSGLLRTGTVIGIGTFTLVFHATPEPAPPQITEGWRPIRWSPPAEFAGDGLRRGVAPTEQAARLLARHVAALRLLACRSPAETATAVVELALAHCSLAAAGWFTAAPGVAPLCSAPDGNRLDTIVTPQLRRGILESGLAVWLTPAAGPAARGDLLCIPIGPAPADLFVAHSTDTPLRAADREFIAVLASLAAAGHAPAPGAGGLAATVGAATTLDVAEWERALIAEALRRHQGNIIAAARTLGMSRATLYRRLGRSPRG